MTRPKNDAQVTFRLPASDKRDLMAAAERRDRSHNWLVREIVLRWLRHQRRRHPRD